MRWYGLCVCCVCITGETVNTLEVYAHSEATESNRGVEVFEWTNEDYIKQTVSGQIHYVTE